MSEMNESPVICTASVQQPGDLPRKRRQHWLPNKSRGLSPGSSRLQMTGAARSLLILISQLKLHRHIDIHCPGGTGGPANQRFAGSSAGGIKQRGTGAFL